MQAVLLLGILVDMYILNVYERPTNFFKKYIERTWEFWQNNVKMCSVGSIDLAHNYFEMFRSCKFTNQSILQRLAGIILPNCAEAIL